MNEKIIIRKYRKSDDSALENVIREAWQYDRYCSPTTARKIAKVYLNSCLVNQTFIRVAEVDSEPVGVIMGKDIAAHKCPFRLFIKWVRSIVSLMVSKEGRAISRMFEKVDKIDQELLAVCVQKYKGELAFFAIAEKCRGKGIGRKLFQALVDEMKACSISAFYLFTDTSCNYQFYEHMGLTRRCEKKWEMDINGKKEEMTFFLYDYQCRLQVA